MISINDNKIVISTSNNGIYSGFTFNLEDLSDLDVLKLKNKLELHLKGKING